MTGGPYTWDARTGRYRGRDGRFVSRAEVRQSLDVALHNAEQRVLARANALRSGELTLTEWRALTADDLKSIHLYSTALARGGVDQVTSADWGRAGRQLRDQYGYLDRLTGEIASGKQPLDGRFTNRMRLYAQSGRVTYHNVFEQTMRETGMTEERNILDPGAESCEDCIAETARGWVPIGELSPIGTRRCLSNDRCDIEYREDGEDAPEPDPMSLPVSAYPPANPDGVDTLERYSVNGVLTAERQALHDAIVEKYLAGNVASESPVVNVMGGGPASGKSVLLSRMGDLPQGIHLDVDEVRALLPDYKEGLAAGRADIAAYTHEEASLLGKRIAREAVDARYNFVADGTGDSSIDSLAKKIAGYRANGAIVRGNYVTVDTDTAMARMIARGKETGRYVPETFLRQVHADVSRTFAQAIERGLFDEFQLWDTNGPSPILVASGKLKQLTIHDEAAWLRFLAKAETLP